MAEPHSTVVAVAVATALSAAPPLIILGAQADALVIGLVAAVLISIWLKTIDNKVKAASAVIFAALLAGYGSPIAATWLASMQPAIGTNIEALRLLLALAIGGAAPSIVPILLRAARKKGEQL